MQHPSPPSGLLRQAGSHGAARVTNIELFFDLVFVFAITQLSHALLHDLSPMGGLHTLILFLAVWWVWIFTSWVTNWLDPERWPVRLALLFVMLAGLLLSTAIPHAFEGMGLVFAGAYAAMQVGRSLFMLAALGRGNPGNTRNFQRITAWLAMSGLVWLAGAAADGPVRIVLWILALAIEYAGPALGFRFPGLGRSTTADWDVRGGHLAERCSLFVIIALGESVLVTGSGFGELAWTGETIAAFVVAFAGSIAMWWIYFDTGMETASARIAESNDPGRLARVAYTYFHLPIVAGIVVCAVADELALDHPGGAVEPAVAATILGGPALYLVGNILFKHAALDRWPLSHLAGIAMLAGLVPVAGQTTPLLLAGATSAVLILVAGWETLSLRGLPRRRPAPKVHRPHSS